MGAIGPWQIVIILVIALLLFGGGGRISSMMGDFAKGIRSFRKGLSDADEDDKKDDDPAAIAKRADEAVEINPAPAKEKNGAE